MALGRSGLDTMTGIGAAEAAVARIEAVEQDAAEVADRAKATYLVRRAIKLWRRGEVTRTAKLALRATETDPSYGAAFHMLALALEKMGHLHKALVTYEQAYALDPEDSDLLVNLGLTAWGLKMYGAAADMFAQYIVRRPDSPLATTISAASCVILAIFLRQSRPCARRSIACPMRRRCGTLWRQCCPSRVAPRKR